MKLSDLLESPASDVAGLNTALAAKAAFRDYLLRADYETVVSDLPGMIRLPTAKPPAHIYGVSAAELGLPYDDLHIGVLIGGSSMRAILQRYREERRYTYAIGIGTTSDLPADQLNDVAFSMYWGSFEHEFQHYLDYKRRKDSKVRRSADYLNEPLEFNAHYIQAISDIIEELQRLLVAHRLDSATPARHAMLLRSLRSFAEFEGYVRISSSKSWVEELNAVYRRKYLKRLYGLYREIVSDYPDVPLIKDHVESHLEMIRRNEDQE